MQSQETVAATLQLSTAALFKDVDLYTLYKYSGMERWEMKKVNNSRERGDYYITITGYVGSSKDLRYSME